MRIAALLTCFNRRELTLECLRRLYRQTLPEQTAMDVYLVDDGSSDGTSEAVAGEFPATRLIRGTGKLYWCGGMRLAWQTADATRNYDGYLWINDDSHLWPGALSTIVQTYQQTLHAGREGVVVGTMCCPSNGALTYGGYIGKRLVAPGDKPIECESMNGNLVFVPRSVYTAIGNISGAFAHTSGDNDYALRSRRAGFAIWLAPGVLGTCKRNGLPGYFDSTVPFSKRWRMLQSPKGQPLIETYRYAKRHRGGLWPVDVAKLCLRVLAPAEYHRISTWFGKDKDTI